ncbi:MAG: PqqD family protein [Dorea sp.]|nr:PqqD family protein [Dorea sp.]
MKIIKEYILREVAGEAILVPTGKTAQEFNGMITLSETAAFIWKNIEKVDSLQELVDKILEEYDTDYETAYKDAFRFTADLIEYEIAQPTKEDMSW